MALSGIQIYKLLPQTNCKDCGFPTCLAFAMKLAAKQVELATCPQVSAASKEQLAESAAPPVRLVTLKANGHEVKAGNEVVLFRHEKTFYHMPGLFIHVSDEADATAIADRAGAAEAYSTSYVGIDLALDGFAVEAKSGDAECFAGAVAAVRSVSNKPLILIGPDASVLAAGLQVVSGEKPLIGPATLQNWEAMASLAKTHSAALFVQGSSLDELADLTEKVKAQGVEDLVLDAAVPGLSAWLSAATQIRRLALKKNFRALGYPLMAFPGNAEAAAQAICKYAGFIVIPEFAPELAYSLLVLRQNIYTDPQKPIQVQPGLYEINSPTADSPLLVTTNFSITYFSVANEVEGSGQPAWLLVTDAEGMSVLTAWAAGKFDAERIAKAVKSFNVSDKLAHKQIVLPGHVAVLSGELESELPGWDIRVGPREAVDLPKYLKQVLARQA